MQKAGASQIYHILLLDDEPLILMGLEDEACACGFEVLLASDCGEALDMVRGPARIDVAVLDFRLAGGRNCTAVARALQRRNIPFVLHSGDMDLSRADWLVPDAPCGSPSGGDPSDPSARAPRMVQVATPSAADTVIAAARALVEGNAVNAASSPTA